MKKSIGLWQLVGFAVTTFSGTLLHFLYEWLGEAVWIAPFSGVNESTWEHMKLLFWPMFVFAVVEFFFFRDRRDFWCVKLCGTLVGIGLIPTIFYIYNGVIGKSPDWINILIFFVCAAVGYLYEIRLFCIKKSYPLSQKISFSLLCLVGLCFVIFTFITPELAIFKDPLTGSYGM